MSVSHGVRALSPLGRAIWLEAGFRLSRTGMSKRAWFKWYVEERGLQVTWWMGLKR